MSRKYTSKNNFFNSAYRALALTVAGATLASSLNIGDVYAAKHNSSKKPQATHVLSDGDHTSGLYPVGPIVDYTFDIVDPNANYRLDNFKPSKDSTKIKYSVVSADQGLENMLENARRGDRIYFTTTGIAWFEDAVNFLTNYPVNHGKPGFGVQFLQERYQGLSDSIAVYNNKITQRDIQDLSAKVKDGILASTELVDTTLHSQVTPGIYALERALYTTKREKNGRTIEERNGEKYQFFRIHDFPRQAVLNPLPHKQKPTLRRIPSDGGVTSLYDLDIKRTPSSIPVYRYKEVTFEPVPRGTIQDLLKDTTQVYQPKAREKPVGIQATPFEKTPVFQPKVKELVTAQPDTTKNHTLRNIGIGVVGLGFLAAIAKAAFSGGKDKKGDGIRGGETGGDGIE